MMEGWAKAKLKNVTSKIGSGATPRGGNAAYKATGISLIRSMNVHDEGFDMTKLAFIDEEQAGKLSNVTIEEGDVLLNITGASVARCCLVPKEVLPARVNQHVSIIRLDQQKILPRFLHYLLISKSYKDELLGIGEQGATRQAITKAQIEKFELNYPVSIDEQERIVAKLDAVFAAINQAKANVERNLQNAKELFQSKLNEVFSGEKEGWLEKPLSECIRLKSGDGLTAKNMIAGDYPVYGGNGIAGHHNAFNLEGSNVIIGRVGALCGNARHVNEPIWLTDNAFKVSDFIEEFDHEFLTLLLNYSDLRSYARQAAQPVVSNSSMKDVPLVFPTNVEEQTTLVGKFENLREVLASAETNYTRKLTELETLKKSVLERAFRGEI